MITIFTPTYNRAYILGRAYESLRKQTDKNFVWLIIDDGSTDDTQEVVKRWIDAKDVTIKYIRQENQGKHIAHNTAVTNCDTEFLLILDSDDYLDEKAIEILENQTKTIQNLDKISGIIGNRYYSNNKVIGKEIPEKIKYISGIELYEKYKFKGDTLRLYKTDILKKNLFPIIKGEKFIYENVVFDKIDSKYKMLINRDRLYYCEYLDDGYTKNSEQLKKKNPISYALALNSGVKYGIKFSKKIKWTILYIIWSKDNKIKQYFKNFCNKILFIILYPVAIFLRRVK